MIVLLLLSLFIILLVLKLCRIVQWSWWWICAPLWIWAGLLLLGHMTRRTTSQQK